MSLPPDVYYSQEYFDAEKRLVFGKSWVCVGYTQQLERPGGMTPVLPIYYGRILLEVARHSQEGQNPRLFACSTEPILFLKAFNGGQGRMLVER